MTKELERLVMLHRSKDLLTCPEQCFCWDIITFIEKRKHKVEQ